MGAEACHAFGVQLIEAACSSFGVGDQASVFEHAQVLGDGGTADGESGGDFVDGDGAGGEFLEDGHAGGIAEGIEAGL